MKGNNLTIYQFNNLLRYVSYLFLSIAIIFNLFLYRLEPSALVDPNDNAFQYALVDRTNQIWDFASKKCSGLSIISNFILRVPCRIFYLADHWVPNWAQGYNLPYYYSHIPQILVVATYRIFARLGLSISLFQYFHLVIYLLMCFFPLSVFLSLRIIGLSYLSSGIGALLASHISTDGLYGLDPPSFLWRGWGLSSQLYAMIFMPLAVAYSYMWLSQSLKKHGIQNNGKETRRQQFLKELTLKTLFWRGGTKFSQAASRAKHNDAVKIINSAYNERYELKNGLRAAGQENFRYAVSQNPSFFLPAVLFLTLTTACHLGMGIITFITAGILSASPTIYSLLNQRWNNETKNELISNIIKLMLLSSSSIFFLSYWIIPSVIHNNYHNVSFWDPIWKFNSYGAFEVLKNLFNGDLFDFGRFPLFTLLVLIGVFVSLRLKNNSTMKECDNAESSNSKCSAYPCTSFKCYGLESFSFLFLFWLIAYFGRTTWGGLVNLIPGMSEFHLSRFIVGLHLSGLFLAPIGLTWLSESLCQLLVKAFSIIKLYIQFPLRRTTNPDEVEDSRRSRSNLQPTTYYLLLITYFLLLTAIIPPVYRQTIRYNDLNNTLIRKSNNNYDALKTDADELISTLKSLPAGRVYPGRGGAWGKNFRIAETPYYLFLSTYGINTVLWLPETWSLNSDTEQYFSEGNLKDYDLYAIRYVVAPPDQKPQTFWKIVKETKSWKLYEITGQCSNETVTQCKSNVNGYITTGQIPAVVSVSKRNFINVVRLWIQSDYHAQGLYPQITFDSSYPKNKGLPNFKMTDEATYKVPRGSLHNLFAEPPVYLAPECESLTPEECSKKEVRQNNNINIISQESDSDMVFKATVEVKKPCTGCAVILKQTSHPSWQVRVDGKKVRHIDVFPFFVAVPVESSGTHEIMFEYAPSGLKVALFVCEIMVLLILLVIWTVKCKKSSSNHDY